MVSDNLPLRDRTPRYELADLFRRKGWLIRPPYPRRSVDRWHAASLRTATERSGSFRLCAYHETGDAPIGNARLERVLKVLGHQQPNRIVHSIGTVHTPCGNPIVMAFTARIWKGEDGFYIAQCEELPGCITQGKSVDEVKRNFGEALELYLEDALQKEAAPKAEEVPVIERIRFELAPA